TIRQKTKRSYLVFCDKCGAELPNEARFCLKCGFALTPGATPPATVKKQRPLTFMAVAATIAGIIILLALPYNGFFWDHSLEAFLGVILLAAGITYIWRHSRFFRQ